MILYDVLIGAKAHKEKECIALIDKFLPLIKNILKNLHMRMPNKIYCAVLLNWYIRFRLKNLEKKMKGK